MAAIDRVFSSYEEALSVCGKGYNDEIISEVVYKKTKEISGGVQSYFLEGDALTALAISLARNDDGITRILDIGGACGYHYFASKVFFANSKISWAIVETEPMVQYAKKGIKEENLSFHTSIDSAIEHLGGCDLLHASGTIQCVAEPERLLDRLVAVNAPLMLIARFPIFNGERTVGVQPSRLSYNGPGPLPAGMVDKDIYYPVTFLNKDYVNSILTQYYRIISRFRSPSADYNLNGKHIEGESILLNKI